MLVTEKLSRLSTIHWPFSIDWLPSSTFLVGGAVRDALLRRQGEYLDLDFVLPEEAIATAQTIANAHRAGFVVLDEQRQIARVVFEQGTVDFAQQEGSTLETDLRRRDFTINAIAYNPHQGRFLDPLGGLRDIEKRSIRMVSRANLADDPLRLLRAYRQACQLHFAIDGPTRAVIRQLAPRLGQVAAERVQNELFYLFGNLHGQDWLASAWEDGLLSIWFDQVTPEQFQHCQQIDTAFQLLQDHLSCGQLSQLWGESCTERWPKAIQLAKLASLLSPQIDLADQALTRLKCSRQDSRAVLAALKQMPCLNDALLTPMTIRGQYFFFLEVGAYFPIAAILALASGVPADIVLPLIRQYLDASDPVSHPPSIITGRDLIQQLHLRPGPLIGQLLTEIQVAIAAGQVGTFQEAIQLARRLLAANP